MATHPKLQRFYASKAWRGFREATISERGIVCQHCGLKILDGITVHHIDEITIDNIDDALISLNPEKVLIVHTKGCHNEIHSRFGYSSKRQVFLVYGPPLSGKTTYVNKYKQRGDLLVDMDRIYQAITGLEKFYKPNSLLSNAIAVQNTLIDNIKTRYGKWHNAWIVGGYADKYKRDRIINGLGAEPILIDTSKEECITRLELDEKRKNLGWEEYIIRWFEEYTPPVL